MSTMAEKDPQTLSVEDRSRRLTDRFAKKFEEIMPDSLTIAFILVIVVAVLAVVLAGAPIFVSEPNQQSVADAMGSRFWNLLQFSMQMALVTILGNVLASSPPMKFLLRKFCGIPKTETGAYILCSSLGYALAWCHWAVGWMGCIVIGKEMLLIAKERGMKIHVPSFVACLFCTALMGATAISASHILYASTPGYLKQLVDPETAKMLLDSYSISDTVLFPAALIMGVLSYILAMVIIMAMRPKQGSPIEEMSPEQEAYYSMSVETKNIDRSTLAKKLSNSVIIQFIIVALMGYWCLQLIMKEGIMGMSINRYNHLVLVLTLAFCMRPKVFADLFIQTVTSVWAFIIQYPFYAGIFGIIVGTGLDKTIANFFLSFATAETWPSIAFLYSAILNIFVPSAGSKFVIEAPYIIPITLEIGTKMEVILQAYGFGDCATNMLAPFWWILPCGLFKIDFHKVLPYAIVASLGVTVFCFFGFFLW